MNLIFHMLIFSACSLKDWHNRNLPLFIPLPCSNLSVSYKSKTSKCQYEDLRKNESNKIWTESKKENLGKWMRLLNNNQILYPSVYTVYKHLILERRAIKILGQIPGIPFATNIERCWSSYGCDIVSVLTNHWHSWLHGSSPSNPTLTYSIIFLCLGWSWLVAEEFVNQWYFYTIILK